MEALRIGRLRVRRVARMLCFSTTDGVGGFAAVGNCWTPPRFFPTSATFFLPPFVHFPLPPSFVSQIHATDVLQPPLTSYSRN
jgi:hypothetical protein